MAFNPVYRALRWVACHLVLLTFCGFAAWAYWWRAELFPPLPEWWPLPPRAAAPEVVPAQPATPVRPQPPQPIGRGPAALFRPPELAPEPAPAASPGPASDAGTLLQAARLAYWEGDMAAAEARYREFVLRYPDDPDGYGELGNLLQVQERQAEALTAFFEAAVRLRAAGREEAAAPLIEVLREAGDERALLFAH